MWTGKYPEKTQRSYAFIPQNIMFYKNNLNLDLTILNKLIVRMYFNPKKTMAQLLATQKTISIGKAGKEMISLRKKTGCMVYGRINFQLIQ
jgi:hypothetical protein